MSTTREAMQQVPRQDFLPSVQNRLAHLDRPLHIGFGQTCSQPTTVRLMLEWLELGEGMRVLEVGSGSGWVSAIISKIVGDEGMVIGVERISDLVRRAKDTCTKLGLSNVKFYHAKSGGLGWPEAAPYDRILVSASADTEPLSLFDQLKPGGLAVMPVRHSIWVYHKTLAGQVTKTEHRGFAFVPLVY